MLKDVGKTVTRKSVTKVKYPAFTFCPFLNEPLPQFGKNLTHYYQNLIPLEDMVFTGVQGLGFTPE